MRALAFGQVTRSRVAVAALVLPALALLAILGWWQWQTPGSALREHLAQREESAGLAAMAQGASGLAKARAHFQAALSWNAWQRASRWRLVELALQTGDSSLAFLHLQAYTELFADDSMGWLTLAGALREGGALVDAERIAGRAVEVAPRSPAARLLRAELRLENGRLFAAGTDIEAVLQAQPRHPQAREMAQRLEQAIQAGREQPARTLDAGRRRGQYWPRGLGQHVAQVLSAISQQDWEQARQRAQQAGTAFPQTMFGPWLQAVVALNRADYQIAEQLLLEALQFAPRSQRAVTLMTQVWARWLGATQAGIRLFELAREDPGFELPWTIAAQAFIEARQPDRALSTMREGLGFAGSGAIPYRRLVDIHRQLDDPTSALRRAREGLQRYPEDRELAALLPQLLAELGQADAADRAFEKYLQRWPADRALTARWLHLMLDAFSERSGQMRELLERLELDYPSEPAVLDAMARAWLQLGEHERARSRAHAAVTVEPDNPLYIYRLGSIRAALGDAAGAMRAIDRALATPGDFPERIDALVLRRRLQSRDSSAADGQRENP